MSLPETIQFRPPEGIKSSELFQQRLDYFIKRLWNWESQWQTASSLDKQKAFYELKTSLFFEPGLIEKGYKNLSKATADEKLLFENILTFFSYRHLVDPVGQILASELRKPLDGKVFGIIGPLGCGKTTFCNNLTEDLRSKKSLVGEVTREPWENNPFWSLSYQDSSYMLRSQVFFLLSNIQAEIQARLAKGISVSDTSILTDIFMWVEWHYQSGRLNEEEYKTYHSLVNLLKPIIPKQDLLLTIIPDSVDKLKEGIRRRNRPEEQKLTEPDDNSLTLQIEIVKRLIRSIPHDWGINVLNIIVDPLEIFVNKSISYAHIYEVREQLGILGDLLDPKSEEVKKKIVQILAVSGDGKVIVVHSKSMFSGKTTALCLLADDVSRDKILAFQPEEAIRDTESGFEDQRENVVSRTKSKIPAITIEKQISVSGDINGSSLMSIIDYIDNNKITFQEKPYIFIDDIMLFTAQADNHKEAIDVLEKLRVRGFHVIVDGIDYTFQEKPFTFMHSLLNHVLENNYWQQIETTTRCRWCNKLARGTRLYMIDSEGNIQIAPVNLDFKQAGSLRYEPVCCEKDASCIGLPVDFTRVELPV